MTAIANGDKEELRRISEGASLANGRRMSVRNSMKRTETMKALQRRATEYHRYFTK